MAEIDLFRASSNTWVTMRSWGTRSYSIVLKDGKYLLFRDTFGHGRRLIQSNIASFEEAKTRLLMEVARL